MAKRKDKYSEIKITCLFGTAGREKKEKQKPNEARIKGQTASFGKKPSQEQHKHKHDTRLAIMQCYCSAFFLNGTTTTTTKLALKKRKMFNKPLELPEVQLS